MHCIPNNASFRDPSGFVFEKDGEIFRAVAASYRDDYDTLMTSGLYRALEDKQWIIPHEMTEMPPPEGFAFVIKPQRVPFISYPYEWSFSQLRQAALLTLKIQAKALESGMTLKDASAFNITWFNGKPVFIDTLSFARLRPDSPWHAYGQFCMHFLAPLALMRYKDIRLQKLLTANINGIPLDLASALLPKRTWADLGCLLHIHLHARSRKKHSAASAKAEAKLSPKAQATLVEGLRMMVEGLTLPGLATEWGDYYSDTNYTPAQFEEKKKIVKEWLQTLSPRTVCDLGANDGTFSRLAAEVAPLVVAADMDPWAVERNARQCRKDKDKTIIPLLQDLAQPSPAIGWGLQERPGLFERLRSEMGMALALVHHLAIGNNIPLPKIAAMLARVAPNWIVEFPDKNDSQVQRLLRNREDIFPGYTPEGFENALAPFFEIKAAHHIAESRRTLYLLQSKTLGIC